MFIVTIECLHKYSIACILNGDVISSSPAVMLTVQFLPCPRLRG